MGCMRSSLRPTPSIGKESAALQYPRPPLPEAGRFRYTLRMAAERLPAALAALASQATARRLGPRERVVVFSDLHLGNGGSRDDFLPNAELLSAALRRYYLPRRFTLVLNGDVEELQRFRLADIRRRYAVFYGLLEQFARLGRLERLLGNHDAELAVLRDPYPAARLLEALCLELGGESILLFHGHQASYVQTYFLGLVATLLRYAANPLGIHNWSVSRSNPRRFRVEKRVYAFARAHRQLVLIGHTHRPLFQSLSKLDALRFRIEELCRRVPSAGGRRRAALEEELAARKVELEELLTKHGSGKEGTLYTSPLLVPCLFNSGCCIGRRGLTGMEIAEGSIALVHWFDRNRSERFLDSPERSEPLAGGPYHRVVLEQDSLAYLATRVRLLA
jgi:predicted phosphodiesterase